LRTGLKTGVEDVNEIGDGLLNYLFGPKRNKKLKKSAFLKFLHDLRSEMDALEFSHYDVEGEGKITARDFGYALVAGSKVHDLPLFLSKVKTLPGREARNRVSRADFIAFCQLAKHGDGTFQTKMQEISDSGAPISRERFAKLAKKTMGVKLSREVINIIFHVFDVDGDDSLSYEEFFNALITWK
jgi:Ca2+-binding EF-hand superfamily protein